MAREIRDINLQHYKQVPPPALILQVGISRAMTYGGLWRLRHVTPMTSQSPWQRCKTWCRTKRSRPSFSSTAFSQWITRQTSAISSTISLQVRTECFRRLYWETQLLLIWFRTTITRQKLWGPTEHVWRVASFWILPREKPKVTRIVMIIVKGRLHVSLS